MKDKIKLAFVAVHTKNIKVRHLNKMFLAEINLRSTCKRQGTSLKPTENSVIIGHRRKIVNKLLLCRMKKIKSVFLVCGVQTIQ